MPGRARARRRGQQLSIARTNTRTVRVARSRGRGPPKSCPRTPAYPKTVQYVEPPVCNASPHDCDVTRAPAEREADRTTVAQAHSSPEANRDHTPARRGSPQGRSEHPLATSRGPRPSPPPDERERPYQQSGCLEQRRSAQGPRDQRGDPPDDDEGRAGSYAHPLRRRQQKALASQALNCSLALSENRFEALVDLHRQGEHFPQVVRLLRRWMNCGPFATAIAAGIPNAIKARSCCSGDRRACASPALTRWGRSSSCRRSSARRRSAWDASGSSRMLS